MVVQKKSKRIGSDFGLNHIRSKNTLKMLRLLGEGMPQCEIGRMLSLSKTRVNYWSKKFKAKDFIRVKSAGKPTFYELTPLGSKALTTSEWWLSPACVMEDYGVKFGLVKDYGRVDWKKLGEPRNWVKLGIKIGSCSVEETSKSIIIHTGQIPGFDPDALLLEAGVVVGRVRDFLERNGVEMESFGLPLHRPMFKFYTPESEVLNSLGTFSTDDGSIDHSPPEGISHVEWDYEAARNYLEMPNRLKRVERNLELVSDSMAAFARGMNEHMNLIIALQDVCSDMKNLVRGLFVSRSM